MRVTSLLNLLVNQEALGGPPLEKVIFHLSQQEAFGWAVLYFNARDRPLKDLLLGSVSPVSAGELVACSSSTTAYSASKDCFPHEVRRDEHVRNLLSPSLEAEILKPLQSPTKGTSVAVLRLKANEMPKDAVNVRNSLLEGTWFSAGVVPHEFRYRQLTVTVGAQTETVTRSAPTTLFTGQHGSILFCAVVGNCQEGVSRIRVFGNSPIVAKPLRLRRDQFLEAIGFDLADAYGYDMVIGLEIHAFSKTGLEPQDVLPRIAQHPSFRDPAREHVREQLERSKEGAVQELEARRRNLRSRDQVYLSGTTTGELHLGPEPTNENETLIMVGKLQEALRAHFKQFTVLEHTGQKGIDGLLQIKFAGALLQQDATVEYEFDLNNYFTHQHPLNLTDFIICWSADGVADGAFDFAFRKHRAEVSTDGWIRRLNLGKKVVVVLPLQQFPGIRIKGKASR